MKMNLGDKEFHIAPMIDVSTIEFRYFIRLLTKRAVIWNQMVVAETLVHRHRIHTQNCSKEHASYDDDADSNNSTDGNGHDVELTPDLIKHCGWYDDSHISGINPHPTICQIGSNIPSEAAFATNIAFKCGYDSIDLNSECPSDRVAGRCFGAALMKDQQTSKEVVSAMLTTSQSLDKPLPVSVKTRIGVDDQEGFEFISSYIQRLVNVGCTNFIIHARKVFMEGLDPAQNRTVPPLDYPCVYRLMEHFPNCTFIHNGGIRSLVHARELAFGSTIKFDKDGNGREESNNSSDNEPIDGHVIPCQQCNLPHGSCLHPPRIAPPNMRGVMVARLARDRPADLADIDRYFYGESSNPCKNRRELMERYISFLERIYPRRCCDDDETITLGMARDMPTTIVPTRPYCTVCREFRGQNGNATCEVIPPPQMNTSRKSEASISIASNKIRQQRQQSGKRAKRHDKYEGAKIVTRVIDRALQPTWSILAGTKGKRAFVNTSHELSRDKTVRNCGPAYVLWKAMKAVPDEVWDKQFELSGERKTSYYPTK